MNKKNKHYKAVPVEKSVGKILMHDITRVVPGKEKGPAFRKGHVIREEDIEVLKDLGKERIYSFKLGEDEYHEDEAARLFKSLAGEGIEVSEPKEGKIIFTALNDGMVKIDKETVNKINQIGDIAFTTIHTDIPVKKGDAVGGIRAIPLTIKKEKVNKALAYSKDQPPLKLRKYKKKKIGLIVTGSEVASGRIEDGFKPVIQKKVKEYGYSINDYSVIGDDAQKMKSEIKRLLNENHDFIILTGGMSVDPDDRTKEAIGDAGIKIVKYGVPVLPGNMFTVGYAGDTAVFGVPACALFHDITVMDIFLPYVFAEITITREMLAERGYGGYCRHCEICVYPRCALGKI